MRRPLVVGNWKMHGTKETVAALIDGMLERWQGMHQAEVGVCPPFVHLHQVGRQLAESNIFLGAQDVSPNEDGAYTGDISAAMLSDHFCHFVIVGHSERRQYHKESNGLIARKVQAAVDAKLLPILCIGESLEQREANETLDVVAEQLKAVIDQVGTDAFAQGVIAYEPVWAIGTGKTATPEQAEEVHAFIREQLGEVGERTRILYGGSVKATNAQELFAQANIDGALVGGASLVAEEFIAICRAAE